MLWDKHCTTLQSTVIRILPLDKLMLRLDEPCHNVVYATLQKAASTNHSNLHVVYEFHERQLRNSKGDLLSCSQRPPLLQSSSNNISEESSSLKTSIKLAIFCWYTHPFLLQRPNSWNWRRFVRSLKSEKYCWIPHCLEHLGIFMTL